MKITQHSAWRISLAHKIAPAFTVNAKVEACFVFGSAALGIADQYSDLELALFGHNCRLPENYKPQRKASVPQIGRLSRMGEAKQAWLEQFYLYGMKVEVGHWAKDTIDNIVIDVVERYDVAQNGLLFEASHSFHLQHAVVLYSEDIIKHWQTRLSPYPEELAVAMVQKHLRFRPFDGQQILTERLEIPMLYENNCAIVRWLLNLLFGLNRIYHPGFKWTRHFVEEMSIKPPEFFARLERVFQSNAVSGTYELRRLVEETFDLVEQHLPQVDLKPQRRTFNYLYPKWRLPVSD